MSSRRRFFAEAGGAVLATAGFRHVAWEAGAQAGQPSPIDLSVVHLAAAMRRGRVSSEAVVSAHLDRISRVNPRLNAVVQLRRDGALADARVADRVPQAARGALHGVPFTLKDSFDTAGVVSAAGTKGRAHYVPTEDATICRRLRAAGAILLGKGLQDGPTLRECGDER